MNDVGSAIRDLWESWDPHDNGRVFLALLRHQDLYRTRVLPLRDKVRNGFPYGNIEGIAMILGDIYSLYFQGMNHMPGKPPTITAKIGFCVPL